VKKIEETLEELLRALSDDPLFKDFEKVRLLVQNDPFLIETERKLKDLQQKMTKSVMDKKAHNEAKLEYETLKKAYEEHPYVINYNNLLDDVNELLHTLKTIIE